MKIKVKAEQRNQEDVFFIEKLATYCYSPISGTFGAGTRERRDASSRSCSH